MQARNTYARLRSAQVRRELRDLIETLKGAAPVILGVAGPVMIALPAFAAVPFFYAASVAWPRGTAVLLAALCAALIPFVLLIRRFLPLEQLHWEIALPVTARDRCVADSVTAAYWLALLCPLIGLSFVVWRIENPRWIADSWPTVLPLAGCWSLVMFLACHGVLRFRVWLVRNSTRARRPSLPVDAKIGHTHHAIRWRSRGGHLARSLLALLVKPLVRREQAQLGGMLLIITTLQAVATWLWFDPSLSGVTTSAKGVMFSVYAVVAFSYLDNQTGKHVDALRATLASYPLRLSILNQSAFAIAILPMVIALIVAFASGIANGTRVAIPIARLYAGAAGISTIGIAVLRTRARTHRPACIVVTAILLSAIGAYVQ